jgi:YgiT-type zinc finger domain-containing protein
MHLRHLTYFTWLGEELITVQNFPAWICDVCGRREYDQQAVLFLNTMLNPEAGRPTTKRRNAPRRGIKPQRPVTQPE